MPVSPQPPKNKNPAGAVRASGLLSACFLSSIQTGSGAAVSRDGGGVDAPGKSFRLSTYRIAAELCQSKLQFNGI
jgi:hypothetical protein